MQYTSSGLIEMFVEGISRNCLSEFAAATKLGSFWHISQLFNGLR
jgi:hypothetical protein